MMESALRLSRGRAGQRAERSGRGELLGGGGHSISTRIYRIVTGDGRSTEELVAAGDYGYAHSCVTSENFPVRPHGAPRVREITLLEFDRDVTSEEAVTAAVQRGLARPTYEDALYFGIEYPDVQRERPIVFLHDPWLGYFGRRDVLCLWSNAGRRELGLEGFDDRWSRDHRFGFVGRHQPDASA